MQNSQADFDEPDARRIVLLQAIETSDPRGKLISEAERDEAERAVLARHGAGRDARPGAAWFLAARAAELMHTVESRSPSLARLDQRDVWWDRLGWLLPLAALVAGAGSDRLFNWSRTDLLSVPLVGVIAWNLVVYAWLAVSAVRGQHNPEILRGVFEMPSWFSRRAAARVRESAGLQFRLLWWRVAGALEAARLYKVMHLSAAAWATGVVLSIVLAGVATQFRVGWESTWLGPRGVHAVLEVMALPARAIGIQGFSLEEVKQLEFRSGVEPGQAQAQRWALTYIAFLAATVILPRLLLWLFARYRVHVLGRRVRLDVSGGYFAGVLARVSPARILIGVRGGDARLREALMNLLAQASAGHEGTPGLLATPQGDRLDADTGGGGGPPDVVWLLASAGATPADLSRHRTTVPAGCKVLVLCEAAGDAPALGRGFDADALPLADCGACWALEQPLREWLVRNVPAHQRPGAERLAAQWSRHHADRFAAATRLLGDALAESVRDSEEVAGMLPGGKARGLATGRLLSRLQERLDGLHRDLVRLHAVELSAVPHTLDGGSGLSPAVGQAGAGAAGALAGALAGAKIDLLTGGLSLGAGMAIGAVLGGAGVFTAARWWLLGGTVRLSDEQVQSLAELLVMQYLAVIHSGRARDHADGRVPANWASETVACVAAAAKDLKSAAKAARDKAGDAGMAALFERVTWHVLGALYGAGQLSRAEGPARPLSD